MKAFTPPPTEAEDNNLGNIGNVSKANFPLPDFAQVLEARMETSPAEAVIGAAYGCFGDRFALVSSFGAESAVLLHIASKVSKDIPVIFLDTGKLYGETKRYRDTLIDFLDLKQVTTVTPDENEIEKTDPKGHLWHHDPNRCCFMRKVVPLNTVLKNYDAWATGRKRFQGGHRKEINHFEFVDGRIKVNPLAYWKRADIQNYIKHNNLPQHPLVADGFTSIGCTPCTDRTQDGEEVRAGRWRGHSKHECGIHLSMNENTKILNKQG